jgi:hypothetical protein
LPGVIRLFRPLVLISWLAPALSFEAVSQEMPIEPIHLLKDSDLSLFYSFLEDF